ncbi:hypothetical protein BD289DRAFT_147071 [Coniella lustricola]|uniref:Uncharacterized protein n=1 Tax=Coniella lustricola TaxID=2025994 RepID=A0A2T2ZV32_9PEZI|nr:hypothetical protein BD289DRAFT_147071 [Coniella lustricola]
MGQPLHYYPDDRSSIQSVADAHVHSPSEAQAMRGVAMSEYAQQQRPWERERQQLQQDRLGIFAAQDGEQSDHLVALPYQAARSHSTQQSDYHPSHHTRHASAHFRVHNAGIGAHFASSQLSAYNDHRQSQQPSTAYPTEIFEDDAVLISQPARHFGTVNNHPAAANRHHRE